MDYTLEELQIALNEMPPFPYELEQNLFSVGTRGFYENPFTEVLAYLLNQKSEYLRKDDFLKTLLTDIVPEEVIQSLIHSRSVSTQHTTLNGNSIDMILYNQRFVLVFENKIFHHLNNPLDDYVENTVLRFPAQDKYFIVMSYKTEKMPEGWSYLNIQRKFNEIIKGVNCELNNKWDYFVRDFLLQFSNKSILRMEDNIITFFEGNFSKIIDARNKLNDFIKGVAEEVAATSSQLRYRIVDNWGPHEIAIRFYPFSDDNNITLVLTEESGFKITIYYYDDFFTYGNQIYEHVGREEYQMFNERTITCFSRTNEMCFLQLKPALQEVNLQLGKMREYYNGKENRKVHQA